MVGQATPAEAGLFEFLERFLAVTAEAETDYKEAAEGVTASTMSLFTAASHSDPNPAKGGSDIIIEDDALVATLSPSGESFATSRITNDAIVTYTVKPGDTMSAIAEMFGVKRSTIRWSNDIRFDDVLSVGQELVILPIDGLTYEVKKDDTLASIAKKFKADAQGIANFNEISIKEALVVGAEIVIPNGVDNSRLTTSSVASGSRVSGGNLVPSGTFIRPVRGQKTQGPHGRGLRGIDFGAPTGTPVHAAATGKVIISRSGYNGGFGNYIVVEHPELRSQTLYAHLHTRNVSAGEWVRQGQKIGSVGNTGRSTGPHLHFEVRGSYRNPF